MFSDMNGDFFCVCTCKNEKNIVPLQSQSRAIGLADIL